jgi:hypothetical protein
MSERLHGDREDAARGGDRRPRHGREWGAGCTLPRQAVSAQRGGGAPPSPPPPLARAPRPPTLAPCPCCETHVANTLTSDYPYPELPPPFALQPSCAPDRPLTPLRRHAARCPHVLGGWADVWGGMMGGGGTGAAWSSGRVLAGGECVRGDGRREGGCMAGRAWRGVRVRQIGLAHESAMASLPCRTRPSRPPTPRTVLPLHHPCSHRTPCIRFCGLSSFRAGP